MSANAHLLQRGLIYVFFVSACLLTLAPVSLAADVATATPPTPKVIRVYGGGGCLASNGADAADLFHLSSGAFNFASQNGFDVLCPITRARAGTSSGAEVLVTIRRTAILPGVVTCALQSFSRDGLVVVATDFKEIRNPLSSVTQVLRLRVSKSVPHGHYGMECFVSRQYGIVNYEVREY